MFQCNDRPIDCNMSINLSPAPYDMQSSPNIKGKQFCVFEFLMLLINPNVGKPHSILCALVFSMFRLTGLEITRDSTISKTNGHLSVNASKISLNSMGFMLLDDSRTELPRMFLSQMCSSSRIPLLMLAFCCYVN